MFSGSAAYTAEKVTRHHFDSISVVSAHNATSVESHSIPQHIAFLLAEDAVCQETWQGTVLPPRHWKTGEVAFLPAKSDLISVSEATFCESAIRIDDLWFREFSEKELNYSDIDFRYFGISGGPVPAIATAITTLPLLTGGLVWPTVIEALALSLAASLVFSLAGKDIAETYRKAGLSRERKARVLDFIYVNLSRPISLSELAGVAALSPYHFSRAFKNSLGVPPIRYLLNKRIRRAKRLLSGSITPLVVIASMCGFASQSHLGTAFQFATGKSPGAWRKASS